MFLRLYLLSDQILLDDEWHSINFVIDKTITQVITGFNALDHASPPLNLYSILLFKVYGWSELLLRLPSVIAGFSSLLFLPILIKRTFSNRTALIFSALLAISPSLIFYSRFVRAYSLVVVFSFLMLLCFYQWIVKESNRYALCMVFSGGFAFYAHPGALISITVPFLLVLGIFLFGKLSSGFIEHFSIKVSFRHFLAVSALFFPLLGIIGLPMLLHKSDLPLSTGNISFMVFPRAATLLSGTAVLPFVIIFLGLSIVGLGLVMKQKPLLGWSFLGIIVAYPVFLFFTRPFGIDNAVVLLRYMIVVVPIALLLVSISLDDVCLKLRVRVFKKRITTICHVLIIAFIAALLVSGPLYQIYGQTPNNFTNHSAFQGSYDRLDWQHSDARHVYPAYRVQYDQIPFFYHWLNTRRDIIRVIEYPFDICNYNNLFYYYQHFSGKEVLAGYSKNMKMMWYSLDSSTADMERKGILKVGILNADAILSRVGNPERLRFSEMIDIGDYEAVSKKTNAVIIFHRYMMALSIMPKEFGAIRVYYGSVPYFIQQYEILFGPPIYNDSQIVCFRIKSSPAP